MDCQVCGRYIPEGDKRCTSCGADIKAPPIEKRPLTGLELGAAAGLVLAAIGTLLPWASIPGYTFSPWDSRLKSLLGLSATFGVHFPLDAIFVLIIAGIGLYGVAVERRCRTTTARVEVSA